VTPRDDVNMKNAGLEMAGDVLGNVMESLMTIPAGPDTTIYCQQDGDCGNVDWKCSGHDDYQGVCSFDMSTPCGMASGCNTGVCVQDTCGLGGPQPVDQAKMDAAFDTDPPAFVNQEVWDVVRGTFRAD